MGISATKTDGTPITATGKTPVQTGITSGNVIEYFGRNKDANGEFVSKQYRIVIKQANGATLSQVGYEPKPEWANAIDTLNQQLMHICTRVVDEAEFTRMCETAGDDFDAFFALMETKILPLLQKAKWHVKVVLTENKDGKFFPKLARYPNFLELDNGTPATTLSNSLAKGETYTAVYNTKAPEAEAANNDADPFA